MWLQRNTIGNRLAPPQFDTYQASTVRLETWLLEIACFLRKGNLLYVHFATAKQVSVVSQKVAANPNFPQPGLENIRVSSGGKGSTGPLTYIGAGGCVVGSVSAASSHAKPNCNACVCVCMCASQEAVQALRSCPKFAAKPRRPRL